MSISEDTPKHILLVEDNPGDVELTLEALAAGGNGYRVHVAEDGEEALEFLHKKGKFQDEPTPDLVLLDLNLPKKDGHEVLENIKLNSVLRNIPVVILTSSASHMDIKKSYSLNANAYVIKPPNLETFLDAIKAIKNFWIDSVKLYKTEQA